MNKNYEQPNVKITKLTVDDVIRTSTPGVRSFNPSWLGGLADDAVFEPGDSE